MPLSRYRYRLSRVWERDEPRVCWILLNPSTATEWLDDPTITRVTGFSRRWGFGSAVVVNLFALRSTDPTALHLAPDPVGPENDAANVEAVESADAVLGAWGNHGNIINPLTGSPRHLEASSLLSPDAEIHCLGLTVEGQPRHPLYLRATTRPELLPRSA